jgi:hypothetical protein
VLEPTVCRGVARLAVADVPRSAALDGVDAVEQRLQRAGLWIRRVPGECGEAADREDSVRSGDEVLHAFDGHIEPAGRAQAGLMGLVCDAGGSGQVGTAAGALRRCAIHARRVALLGSDEDRGRPLRQVRAAPHRRPILRGAPYAQCVLCARGGRRRREWFRMDSIVSAR